MANEEAKVNAYMETVERMEPDIHPVDAAAAYASVAISAKRMADAMVRVADAYDEIMKLIKKEIENERST